jgi:hypothetical protein
MDVRGGVTTQSICQLCAYWTMLDGVREVWPMRPNGARVRDRLTGLNRPQRDPDVDILPDYCLRHRHVSHFARALQDNVCRAGRSIPIGFAAIVPPVCGQTAGSQTTLCG